MSHGIELEPSLLITAFSGHSAITIALGIAKFTSQALSYRRDKFCPV
jgi:hypothetical protein